MVNPDSDFSTQIDGLSAQTLDYDALFERLQAGHTLVTGNSRLSRAITGQYNQWRAKQGGRQWASPNIVSWNLWLDQFWERHWGHEEALGAQRFNGV